MAIVSKNYNFKFQKNQLSHTVQVSPRQDVCSEKPSRARKVRVKHMKKETTSPNPIHAKFEHFDDHDDEHDKAAGTARSTVEVRKTSIKNVS